ncbi:MULTISPECIES: sugar kinase [unclassified Bartonella]|uniref:tagatose kinase n=1 Tax=unclassified Bartonella TaxID=2645622 RepID=UPI0015FBA911|nr:MULTISPECIES: sugar kinase [unclassified Bartonella]UXN03164.1 sugar kinase [Bartonella sp. HY406]
MGKVLTIGEILVEIVATTKGDGFLSAQPLIGPFPSGAPAIFIDQVGKLNTPCAIISRVGDDDFGRVNIDRLKADGVDVSAIEIAQGESTGSAFVRYREDGSRAFVYNIRYSACGTLNTTQSAKDMIKDCDHLHVMGSAFSAPELGAMVIEAAKAIKHKGGTISFDPNLRPELLNTPGLKQSCEFILSITDLFMPSGEEIFLFEKAGNEEEAVNHLLARGIKTIVVKRGEKGASLYENGKRFDAQAFKVEEKDPTGAGDCFGGAFLSFWLKNTDPQQALDFANAAGARAVSEIGPMEGTSTLADLERFIAQKAL